MGTKQIHKTAVVFKLPKGVQKGSVKAVYTTEKRISVEGYSGNVNYIKDESDKPPNVLLCRNTNNSTGNAWVQVKKG